MELKYDELQTFLIIHEANTFTKAAKQLGLSQSALSQKVARIEEVLQSAIFVRHPRSLTLTPTGEKLLIYAREAIQMQKDFLTSFDQYQNEVSGTIRIAGFSSVVGSIIIPGLASFIRKHPNVDVQFSTHEMFELENILKTNQADFIITDYFPKMAQCEEVEIGQEEYVIIESKKHKNKVDRFLDHTPLDNTTEEYFKHIGRAVNFSRGFMGDVHNIIQGVKLGVGQAVMPIHLVENDKELNIIKSKKKYKRPIVLSYLRQSYYGPLHTKLIEILRDL